MQKDQNVSTPAAAADAAAAAHISGWAFPHFSTPIPYLSAILINWILFNIK